MSLRKPPAERGGWIRTIRIAGQAYHLAVGEYPDGLPCEMSIYHRSAQIRGYADQLLRVGSRVLQLSGGSISELHWMAEGWRGQRIEPADTRWRSPLDAVGRILLERYPLPR